MPDSAVGTIALRLDEIKAKIDAAARRAGRDPESVKLLAVSKDVPATAIREAHLAGQNLFGENYVQEAYGKKSEFDVANSPTFHLIGHLQRNKVKQAVGLFDLIHTVDSVRLAEEISAVAKKQGLIQKVLVQVNIAGEETKSGVSVDEAPALCKIVTHLDNLNLRGLMCIGRFFAPGAQESEKRKEFVQLKSLRDTISESLARDLPELSMGMSADYEIAIEEGATIVRVGTAIFGDRR